MLARSGSWVGTTTAGASIARYWFYQDFAAGSGPGLTISGNSNGSGGTFVFDSAQIIDSSAVITTTSGNPIYDAGAEDPTDLVTVSAHTGTSVTLSAAPAVGQGTIRIWYLYALQGSNGPNDMEVAPRFVKEVRSQHLDTRYLNSALNLSDLGSAATARTNLGFTSQTSGAVLLGDGSTTFSSDPTELFWDTTDNELGVGTNTPSAKVHLFSSAASISARVETQFTSGVPSLQLRAARTSNANLANADTVGQIDFNGRFNSTNGTLARIDTIYTGNGTTQNGDLVFYTAQSGSVTEALRLNASGQIDTTLGAGAVSSDSSGILTSGTLSIANGGTGATGFTANHVIIVNAGNTALTSEANLAVSRGGTGLSAVGNANELFGTNNAGNAFEHKAATITAAGTLTIPSGQAIIIPDGAVGTPAIRFSSDADTGIYYGGSTDVAIAANGSQAALFASSLVTITPTALFKSALRIEDPGAGTNYVALQSPTLGGDYTLTLPTAQASVAGTALVNDGLGTLSWSTSPVPSFKAGTIAITNGQRIAVVVFATAFGSTNYQPFGSIRNSADNNPQYMPFTVISKTSTGFTVELPENVDSASYNFDWFIIGNNNP